MNKFTSIITITFSNNIEFKNWYVFTEKFFLYDEKVIIYLKEKGMTKWTITKTDSEEPVKAIAVMEYKDKNSFQKCQPIFSKFMPKISNILYKSNVVRGEVIFDKI